jgi:hypothetical protein
VARILGGLRAEDDYTHPLGPEPNFNESMYFNFYDPERAVGGWFRLGNRANEGWAERSVCLYLPDGRVLFGFERPAIASNAAFDAAGLRFDVLEAGQRLRTRFDGEVLELAEPRRLADPGRAFREAPRRRIAFDLVHDAVGPMYGRSHDPAEESRAAEEQFARAHYEQHMAVTGSLDLGERSGAALAVRAHGLRDHSWGPRHWQAIHGYEWLTMNFGSELGLAISVVRRGEGGHERHAGGVVVRGDGLDPIESVSVEADTEENGLYHRAVRADLRTRGGERLTVSGEVLGFVPLRHRREGRVTHVGEGLTRWRIGERVGYGLSELLRQVA